MWGKEGKGMRWGTAACRYCNNMCRLGFSRFFLLFDRRFFGEGGWRWELGFYEEVRRIEVNRRGL